MTSQGYCFAVMSDWWSPLIYSSCDGVWLVDTPEISHTVMSASLSYTHTNYLVTRGHFPWVCILWPLETPKENWGLLQTNSSGVLGWLQYRSKQKLGFTGRRSIKNQFCLRERLFFNVPNPFCEPRGTLSQKLSEFPHKNWACHGWSWCYDKRQAFFNSYLAQRPDTTCCNCSNRDSVTG